MEPRIYPQLTWPLIPQDISPFGSVSGEDGDIDESTLEISKRPVFGGQFCDLYLGQHKDYGKVVLKHHRHMLSDELVLKYFRREVGALRQVSHQNILPFLGTCTIGRTIHTVSPFMKNGNLKQWIEKGYNFNRRKLLLEVADAVAHLHANTILHGDIKAQNVLLSDSGSALLCDFGLSKILESTVSIDVGGRGSTRWTAPELFNNNPKTKKSDVWAFGMTIAEVLSGKSPFHNIKEHAVPTQVLINNARPLRPTYIEENASFAVWTVAEMCWATNPLDRPRMADVYSLLRAKQISPLLNPLQVNTDTNTPISPLSNVGVGASATPPDDGLPPDPGEHLLSTGHSLESTKTRLPSIQDSCMQAGQPAHSTTTLGLASTSPLLEIASSQPSNETTAISKSWNIASTEPASVKHDLAARTIQQAWRTRNKHDLVLAPGGTLDSALNRCPPKTFGDAVSAWNDISGSVYLLQRDPIGCGGFCDLFLGFHQTHKKVALKRPRVAYCDSPPSEIRHFYREAEVWSRISHPNILPFLGTCTIGQNVYLVSPFHQNGDLYKCIRKGMTLDKRKILRQVASAIAHLHSLGIVHGDIKAQNILLSENLEPLLCDLGMAKILGTMATFTDRKGGGSTRWMAPELFDDQPKTMESDVYAFGMMISEVLSGKPPLSGIREYAVVAQVLHKNARPPLDPLDGPDGRSYNNLWSIAAACWARNIGDRSKMSHVVDLLT